MPKELRRVPTSQDGFTGALLHGPVGRFRLQFVHPHLFQFGRLVLPTYGFLVALGTILSLLVCLRTARLLSLDTDKVWSLALRGHCHWPGGQQDSRDPVELAPVWRPRPEYEPERIPRPRTGSHRDRSRRPACSMLCTSASPSGRTADAIAPSLALGSSVVSIGCLEAGCDYGTPTHLPWAVVFTSPAAMPGTPLGVPLHPTQIYASLVEFALFVLLLWLLHRPHHDGEILGAWLFLGGLSSFLLTYLRGDGGWSLSGLITVTQLVAAAMVLAGGLLWLHRPQATQVSHGE